MARLDRLSYREVALSRAALRLRQLLVLLLTIVFGVLLSVSVNAQNTSDKKTGKKKYQVYKIKNRAKPNHYANACSIVEKKRTTKSAESLPITENINTKNRAETAKAKEVPLEVTPLPDPTSFQQSIIREIVAQNLRERADNEPIEIASLLFSKSGNELSANDINPFWIAVEFALQGKTILIEDHTIISGYQNSNYNSILASGIRDMMQRMGVPSERITIADSQPINSSATSITRETETFSLGFTAL
jgi:hypothetical protein